MGMSYHKINGIQISASPSHKETTPNFQEGNYQGGGVKPQVDSDDEMPFGVSPRRRFATSLT